jgi:hypothetical protein
MFEIPGKDRQPRTLVGSSASEGVADGARSGRLNPVDEMFDPYAK